MRDLSIPGAAGATAVGDWSYERGHAAMREILAGGAPTDGAFAKNDRTAAGAIRAIHEAGRRVPDDIAVIGFDDVLLAGYVEPALTTIHIPAFELGHMAAPSLIRHISSMSSEEVRDEADASRLEPPLVIRGSG